MIAYDVDLKSDSATIIYDPTKVTIDTLKQAIIQAGFKVGAVEEIVK